MNEYEETVVRETWYSADFIINGEIQDGRLFRNDLEACIRFIDSLLDDENHPEWPDGATAVRKRWWEVDVRYYKNLDVYHQKRRSVVSGRYKSNK